MKLIIIWKNNKPWNLEIDENKTILQLKKEIASHYKEDYTGFNILNGNKLFDSQSDSKTLAQCEIKRYIRLPDNYVPGAYFLNKQLI